MIIDSMVAIPAMQESDIRIKKKNELEDQRPIEESDKSNDLELDFREDKTEAAKTEDGMERKNDGVGDVYNEDGRLLRESDMKQETDQENRSIDMII